MIGHTLAKLYESFHSTGEYEVHLESIVDENDHTALGKIAVGIFYANSYEPMLSCSLRFSQYENEEETSKKYANLCELEDISIGQPRLIQDFVTVMTIIRNATAGTINGKPSEVFSFETNLLNSGFELRSMIITDIGYDSDVDAYTERTGGPGMEITVATVNGGIKTVIVDFDSIEKNKFTMSTNTGGEMFRKMMDELHLDSAVKETIIDEYRRIDDDANKKLFSIILEYFVKYILPKYTRIKM